MALAATALFAPLAACAGDDEGSVEELCAAVADRDVFTAVFADGFDPTDVDTAIEQLRDARLQLGEIREAAPGEIHDELDVEIDAVQRLIEALESAPPGDSAAAVAAVRAVSEELTEVDEASAALETYVEVNC